MMYQVKYLIFCPPHEPQRRPFVLRLTQEAKVRLFVLIKCDDTHFCFSRWMQDIGVPFKYFPHLCLFPSLSLILGPRRCTLSGSCMLSETFCYIIYTFYTFYRALCVFLLKYKWNNNIYLKGFRVFEDTFSSWIKERKRHTSRNLIIHRQCIESCLEVENQRQTYVQELQITNRYIYIHI